MKYWLVTLFFLACLGFGCVAETHTQPTQNIDPSPTTVLGATSTLLPATQTPSPTKTATLLPPTLTFTPAPTMTTIVATGDVMLGRYVNVKIRKNNFDYTWPFHQTKDFLSASDLTLINLENPLLDPCPIDEIGMVFCSPTQSVEGLVFAGIDIVNLANNHMEDHGASGYISTLETLRQSGLQPSDQDNLVVVTRGDTSFGFIGFNRIKQGKNHSILSDQEVIQRISDLDSQVDVLIVSMHWGNEYKSIPNQAQISLGHQAIDVGADLIIGTHPHVTQAVEEYQGKMIFYSLGNFVFDQMQSETTTKGEIVKIIFQDGDLISYNLVPIQIRDYGQPFFPSP